MKDSEILIYLENEFLHNFKIGLQLAKNSKKLRRISDFARKLTEREYPHFYFFYLHIKICDFCIYRSSKITNNLFKIIRYSNGLDPHNYLIPFYGCTPFDKRGKNNNYHYWQNINFRINNGKTIWQTKNKT